MTTLDPNRRVGRPVRQPVRQPVRPDSTGEAGRTDNSGRVGGRVRSNVYSANDRAVANEVRTKLNSGAFDSNPRLKSRVVNLLGTLDTAVNGGLARVPDRNTVNSVMDALRAINSRSADPIRTPPAGGATPPFEIAPVADTDPPERVREMTVEWDYEDTNPDVVGFRLYHEGEPVCEFNSGSARRGTCEVSLSEGSHTFTLTAFKSNGVESPHSAAAVFNYVFPPD